jgi:signal peptidase
MPPRDVSYVAVQPLRMLLEQRGRPRRRPRRRGGLLGILATLMLGGAMLLVVLAAVAMVLGLVRFTVVDSGSMRPTLSPGDVVVLRSESQAKMAVGQIVAFHPPGERRLTVIHRVRAIRRTSRGVIFRTKGDANNASDPWRAKIAGDIVWRESSKIPLLGYVVVWSQRPAVRMTVLGLMLALFVIIALGWIWRPAPRREPRYSPLTQR